MFKEWKALKQRRHIGMILANNDCPMFAIILSSCNTQSCASHLSSILHSFHSFQIWPIWLRSSNSSNVGSFFIKQMGLIRDRPQPYPAHSYREHDGQTPTSSVSQFTTDMQSRSAIESEPSQEPDSRCHDGPPYVTSLPICLKILQNYRLKLTT